MMKKNVWDEATNEDMKKFNEVARYIILGSDQYACDDLFKGCETIEDVNECAADLYSNGFFDWYAVIVDDNNDWSIGAIEFDEAVDWADEYKSNLIVKVNTFSKAAICEYHRGEDF